MSGSPTRTVSSCAPIRRAGSPIFGFYTPSLRTPELIPGQVRLLRSLLIGREPLIARVVLASETDGTYIAKPTPEAEPVGERRAVIDGRTGRDVRGGLPRSRAVE